MPITTKTEITTEYVGMGLMQDGKWKKITPRTNNKANAEQWVHEYICDVRNFPDCYTAYAEYKVMKRTVIKVTEEWGDV